MMLTDSAPKANVPQSCDILIAGAGAVGLAAGLALAQAGRNVIVAGPADTRRTGQTIALLARSLAFLRGLGVADRLAEKGAPLALMRIIDHTRSLFRAPQTEFAAGEIGLAAFGLNVEAVDLAGVLREAVRAQDNCRLIETPVESFDFAAGENTVTLASGEVCACKLVVGADGRRSLARRSAHIAQRDWSYPQAALTAILAHDFPHEDASTEIHTDEGPFTLVPLRANERGKNRSSLVWMMRDGQAARRATLDDAELAREMEETCQSMLGRMRLEGPRGFWPMAGSLARKTTGPRLALCGEAAHSFPPIGAQGMNLSLRDVEGLVSALRGARDPGAAAGLEDYARKRETDIRLRTLGVDALNRSLLTSFMPVDFLRGAGMLALGQIGPLRRAAMRIGLAG